MRGKFRLSAFLAASLIFLCLSLQASAAGLLSYEAPQSGTATSAVLYFRYLDSPYLVFETRKIEIEQTESREKALVKALLSGPAPSGSAGRTLFPEGTEVISVIREGDSLYVTLSEQFLNAIPDENAATVFAKEEAVLRRRLAASALVNTLTESGRFQKVQILVLRRNAAENSMRLSQRYYLEDSDAIPPPLTRQEADILTPGKATEYILNLWRNQDWDRLVSLLAVEPGEEAVSPPKFDANSLPVLLTFSATPGTVSPDYTYALSLVTAEMSDASGDVILRNSQSVRLLRQNNYWLMSLESLTRLARTDTP